MKNTHTAQPVRWPMVKGVAVGVAASLALSIGVAAIAALMILQGKVPEEAAAGIMYASALLASFAGCMLAAGRVGDKRAPVCMAVAGGYAFILAALNIFIFGAGFSGAFITLVMLLCGAAAACLVGLRRGGKKHTRRYKHR